MKDYIEERAMNIANYIIEHNATVRQAAKEFGISKSTVHKDVAERLAQINPSLAAEARKVLDVNNICINTRFERNTRFAADWAKDFTFP